ncbi:helix-turn-helix transcriptional regulator [Azonexus sp.]|uniref:helix-turn-helix transcriptional regulator n=1 Tax=Azonexus sp. TaxID=1872668 RepID=UPI0039E4C885
MNRTERFYRIDQLLRERQVVPLAVFLDDLGVSRATFKRDVEYLRERLHAPIEWDRTAGGYRFASQQASGPRYELPGLWLNAGELYALLAAHQLLADIEPGILAAQLKPLQFRLMELLAAGGRSADAVLRRVRLLSINRRSVEPRFFSQIALALMERRQIEIDAWNRGRDTLDTRVVSPQRLIHYRDNWYLDAWCHWRQALRSFSVDAMQRVQPRKEAAKDLDDAELDAHYASAYGIFAGQPSARAVLRFTAERARWVRSERWHRDQISELLPDGSYRLSVPYADPRELLQDILRHGAQVVVEAPAALREQVLAEARKILRRYE